MIFAQAKRPGAPPNKRLVYEQIAPNACSVDGAPEHEGQPHSLAVGSSLVIRGMLASTAGPAARRAATAAVAVASTCPQSREVGGARRCRSGRDCVGQHEHGHSQGAIASGNVNTADGQGAIVSGNVNTQTVWARLLPRSVQSDRLMRTTDAVLFDYSPIMLA
jgi:hypothetical protein